MEIFLHSQASKLDKRIMNQERALKVVMALVGSLFVVAIYPMAMSLWHPSPSDDTARNRNHGR
jgi:hypothetical protein